MINTKDPYVGDRDPVTRKRHGQGVYTYENSYFQYEGQWKNGKKHGQGKLKMRCGTNIDVYEGEFVNGEIEGQGKLTYANGSSYEGSFKLGEKHGQGVFVSPYETYTGEWQLNMRHGKGVLTKENGEVIEGEFANHKPHGQCRIKYANGSSYVGQMQKGLPHGTGKLIDTENQIEYDGQFENGLKHGRGVIKFTATGYTYDGEFANDQPTRVPNVFVYRIYKIFGTSPDQAITSDPAEKQESKERVKTNDNEAQFEYELGGRPFALEIDTSYQGPDILDPVQPTEEEIQEMIKAWEKENKKNKNAPAMPDFRAPRMIKPQPEIVHQETGRRLKVQLVLIPEAEKGKEADPKTFVPIRVDYRQQIKDRREEIERIKLERERALQQQQAEEQQAEGAAKGKKEKKKETKKAGAEQAGQGEDDLRVALFNPNEEDKTKPIFVKNDQGSLVIQNLEFPEDHPTGKFHIIIQDAAAKKYGTIPEVRIEIAILPQGGVDQKKQKKK